MPRTIILFGVILALARMAMATELKPGPDGAAVVSADGATQTFKPVFLIQYRGDDPKPALRPAGLQRVSYNVPTWFVGEGAKGGLGKVNTDVTAGDGFDPSILKGDQSGRSPDVFSAAPAARIVGTSARQEAGRIEWAFPESPGFSLRATIELPAGAATPLLRWTFIPRREGWYSVAYIGAPEFELSASEEIWQPLIWTEKRFPDRPYLTAAFHCPIPAPMVAAGGQTVGLVVSPEHLPYQPLPTFDNSRFGIAVRNATGKAQPAVFAPILGGLGSKMRPGQPFSFTLGLYVRPGNCDAALRDIARTVFGFRDQRTNSICSLNTTLENMINYGMSEFSRFNEDLRGCAYDTDAPGTVKNVSCLHPLAAALVTDNAEIYRRRARPILEFLLSREKFLFATDPNIKVQHPGWRLLGPCAPVSELTSVYEISGGKNPLLMDYARGLLGKTRTLNLDEPEEGGSWQNYLAMHRATGRKEYLQKAVAGADQYLKQRLAVKQTDFRDPQSKGMFFWTSFAPNWQDLLELYEATGEKRFLDAAHAGAKAFCRFIWYVPAVPAGDVTVNQGGVAPLYGYLKRHGTGPMKIAEETVPAWRLSEIGLTSESSGTSSGHRGVLLACHAPWMLRLAQLTGDEFLHDVARWAVVGRYANFPGYHINTGRTNVYEKADYPMRPFKQLTYNSIHFNHIWPHIALVMDYLVADATARSNGAIAFPWHLAEGYAYLKNRIYGDRPGKFYDFTEAWLWMPKGLVKIDNVELNYIAARAGDTLLLALTNQSAQDVSATLKLDGDLTGFDASPRQVRQWVDNRPADAIAISGDSIPVRIKARGITALAIPNLKLRPMLAAAIKSGPPLAGRAQGEFNVGGGKAMILQIGPFRHVYAYLQATFKEVRSATLEYNLGDGWKTMSDAAYPYEFTVEMPESARGIDLRLTATTVDGANQSSQTLRLGD